MPGLRPESSRRVPAVSTGLTLLLVEDRDWSACSGPTRVIFIFGSTRKVPYVQSRFSQRERVTDEFRAAEEKKHDEA